MEKTPLGKLHVIINTPGSTLDQVLGAVATLNGVPGAWKIKADDVTTNLACSQRYDLLKQIKSLPEFTELAESELRTLMV